MAFDFAAVRSSFFDSERVKSAVDAGTRKALSKCGAFVRTKSKSSIRYRKKASAPGNPPSGHRSGSFTRENKKTGVRRAVSPLKELIFFGYDPSTKSVVVGPVPFGNKKGIPRVLEKGGTVTITVRTPRLPTRKAGPNQAASFRRLVQEGRIEVPKRGRQTVQIRIEARPYMRPAVQSQAAKFPEAFRGVVR